MPIQVALLFEFSSLNGGENSILSVCDHLIPEGEFQFTALAPSTGRLAESLERRGITLLEFCCHDSDGVRRAPQQLRDDLVSHCQNANIQVLHANSLSMCRLAGGLWPSDDHSSDQFHAGVWRTGHLRDIIRLSSRSVADLNNLDTLVAVSEAVCRFHVSQGLAVEKCRVIHNGVQCLSESSNANAVDRIRWRRSTVPQVPDDALMLLCVGQICLRKGQLVLAQAVVELQQEKPGTRIHLVIAGERYSRKAESRDYEAAIQNVFASAGISSQLHLIGFCDAVIPLMMAADLLVHPARQEPFGRVLLEAAAAGLPVVATDVGGTAELIRNEVDGLLVQPGCVTELGRAIRRLASDVADRRRFAESAQTRVRSEFTVSRCADQLANVWRVCLQRSRNARIQ
jgi:glycosyltransferase involved in cell wall biosynthesis